MSLLADLRVDIADDSPSPSGTITLPSGTFGSSQLLLDLRVDIGDDSALVPSGNTVAGPSLSTDNAIVRYDGTTGEVIQNSLAILDDSGNIVTVGGIQLGSYLRRHVRIVTAAGAVTGLATDDVVMVNKTIGEATTFTLPASPTQGQMHIVKDAKGDAFTNNITVSPSAGTIDGLVSFIMTQNYQSFTFIYNGTEWNVI